MLTRPAEAVEARSCKSTKYIHITLLKWCYHFTVILNGITFTQLKQHTDIYTVYNQLITVEPLCNEQFGTKYFFACNIHKGFWEVKLYQGGSIGAETLCP